MRHIVLTSNAYLPNVGGIENSLYYLAKSYKEHGFVVHIIVSDVNTFNASSLEAFEYVGGINIYRYGAKADAYFKPLSRWLSMFSIFNQVKQYKPEITISRYHHNTIVAKLLGLGKVTYLIPGVVREQDKPKNVAGVSGKAKVKQLLRYVLHDLSQQLAFRLADRLQVFSQNMKTQVSDCFYLNSPKVLVVKPGVDNVKFAPAAVETKASLKQKLQLPSGGKLLLAVGRLVKAKGFHYAIEALKFCPGNYLVILGDGPQMGELKSLAEYHNVTSRVFFKGAVAEPSQYYQAADVFLFTSTYEPLGQILLEAISSGLPVVAFKEQAQVVTATTELLGDNAVYVSELSASALADTLTSTNDAYLQQLAKHGRQIVEQKYTWNKLALQLKSN